MKDNVEIDTYALAVLWPMIAGRLRLFVLIVA